MQALEAIKKKVGPDNVAISVGYVGLIPSSYPINTIFLWTSGPEEAVLRVALKPNSGVRVEELKQALRQDLPAILEDWLRHRLQEEKLPADVIAQRVSGLKLSFEPADIVNEVMSFGSPTPVEVAVSGIAFSGPDRVKHLAYVEKVRAALARVPSLRDLQYVQPLDYPTVEVQVDRQLLGASGVTTEDVANSVVAATSSSRFVVPNFWRDPGSGHWLPGAGGDPDAADEQRPRGGPGADQAPGRAAGRATVPPGRGPDSEGTEPGEYDRYNMRRLVSMTANIQGEDLGRVADHIAAALEEAGEPPPGCVGGGSRPGGAHAADVRLAGGGQGV